MKIGELLNRCEKVGDCWLWRGNVLSDGYGRVWVDGKPWRVHRLMMKLLGHELPPDKVVCHSCDTPLCCNPDHLFLGTPKENHHDAMRKGRHTRGTKVNTNKLTEQQVLEIRRRWVEEGGRYGAYSRLSREFGVSDVNIRMIVHHKTWTHI